MPDSTTDDADVRAGSGVRTIFPGSVLAFFPLCAIIAICSTSIISQFPLHDFALKSELANFSTFRAVRMENSL